MIRSVAVIGIGEMGRPIAHRIQSAGFSLTVCDRDQSRLAVFAQTGASITGTPEDCARCDAILILVSNDDQLRTVTLGDNGLAAGIDPSRPPILLVGSTVSIAAMRDIGEALSVPVLDTPVSGGPDRAATGNLTVLAGGDAGTLAKAMPLLESFADNIFACGPLGSGQTVKIINNVICAANIMLMAEGFRIALEQGLDLGQITTALEVSTGRNFLTAGPKSVTEVMAGHTVDRKTFDAVLTILRKDTALGAGLAGARTDDFPVMSTFGAAIANLGDETWQTWLHLGRQMTHHSEN